MQRRQKKVVNKEENYDSPKWEVFKLRSVKRVEIIFIAVGIHMNGIPEVVVEYRC